MIIKKGLLKGDTLVLLDMSTTDNTRISQLLPQQKATLMKTKSNICVPINWDLILARTTLTWTPRSVREYLGIVLNRINDHMAVIMCGPKIGSIEVSRLNRIADQPPIKVILSTWRCQQLFPRKISLAWLEHGKKRSIHTSAFSLWLKSRGRREIQPEMSMPVQPPTVAADWLRHVLSLSHTDACPIDFNTMNVRKKVYESWWELLPEHRKQEWSPKRISEHLYQLLPSTKPIKGKREKLRGVAVIAIPHKTVCYDVLESINVQPLRL